MFSYRNLKTTPSRRTVLININGNQCAINNPKIAEIVSPLIYQKIQELNIDITLRLKRGENNDPIYNFQIKEVTLEQNSELIESISTFSKLFDSKIIKFTPNNYKMLLVLARYFQMESLIESLEDYEKFINNIESELIESEELNFLIQFEELIINFNEENKEETIEECISLLNKMSQTLFLYCLIQYLSLHYENSILYFSLLQGIDQKKGINSFEDNNSFFNVFFSFLKNSSVLKEKKLILKLFYSIKNNLYILKQKKLIQIKSTIL